LLTIVHHIIYIIVLFEGVSCLPLRIIQKKITFANANFCSYDI